MTDKPNKECFEVDGFKYKITGKDTVVSVRAEAHPGQPKAASTKKQIERVLNQYAAAYGPMPMM